ncbi:acetyl-CoA acyltransferase [Streptoalloteichus tenebrarius]|uniref:Acetyl-CoA acyltransferase n=1 Tax=Streptoalloteichus tenebrarius (strain ATCC 17920 / DSM 40477 / JCM 4838 / CBS 697.72 / NBRC 16177 / NCIMB 11028 / NRRL B-12390 / A12253. 1 / ISP 5477) TaxID=1933 RepID=A0ABT1I2X1_STRSD|nr:thiolase family protein [Streptoalloteichus tenebrarius]MCP2262139.1 acetyl-CoA acyltransferase [Streptoalloteichus tenebrarius]BFF01953.1 thiolase family protein [Streptoalloteichus tenebrarius]
MRDAVICAAVRTPVGRRKGALRDVHAVDLGAVALRALVERTGIDPAVVDDVHWGCVTQVGEQSFCVGRQVVLAAGWPETVPAVTVDRQCGSSQQALHQAAAAVISGQADVVVAGGVESMTRVPMGSNFATGPGEPFGPSVLGRYAERLDGTGGTFNQGLGAELIAEKWGLDRTRLDEFSLASHARAAAAQDGGAFDEEIVPVPLPDGSAVTGDEGVRRDSTLDTLAGLRPAFRPDGVVTAANSSQISDGAAALLVTTSDRAGELGLTPIARVAATAVVGDDPVLMLTAPIPATAAVLRRAGLTIGDIGAFEVNEAFAAVPLAWLAETGADPERLNPLGGAIALGHPLGASGARLTTTLLHHMRRNGIRYGLQTMCEGGGMANATIFELL